MEDEIHPVVELLVARMDSHPEEFDLGNDGAFYGRWKLFIDRLGWHMNEAEKKLVYTKVREKLFQDVHEQVLDELLNGPERRAEEKRRELQEQALKAQQYQAQTQAQLAQIQSQYGTLGMGNNPNSYLNSLSALQSPEMSVDHDYANNILRVRAEDKWADIPMEDVADKGLIPTVMKALGLK